jgi:hypothetical protein
MTEAVRGLHDRQWNVRQTSDHGASHGFVAAGLFGNARSNVRFRIPGRLRTKVKGELPTLAEAVAPSFSLRS